MRRAPSTAFVLASAVSVFAAAAHAQPQDQPKPAAPEAKPAPAKTSAAKAPAKAGSGAVRRDPEGKTGISPYMEAVAKGEKAMVGGDIPGAIAAFQEAIGIDGKKMLAHYRLGEAHLASGKLDEAEAAWQTAMGKSGTEEQTAKVHFVMADLRERQRKLEPAREAWNAYNNYIQGKPKANGYIGTAPERQRVIDKRLKDEKDYAAVKDRIAKRQAEREKEAEENAKKDKMNR